MAKCVRAFARMNEAQPIQWPTNPAFAPAPWHPTFKPTEPLHPVQIAGWKKATAAEKFRALENMYRMGVAMKRTQLRKTHPDWDDTRLEREARIAVMHAPD